MPAECVACVNLGSCMVSSPCLWVPTCDMSTGMQVHNALGYAYFNMGKTDIAIGEYKQAVEKQPG